jgi:hypothetical protein
VEGLKESPWYYDNNASSLYRDRMLATVAIAVAAIGQRHELTKEGLQLSGTYACSYQIRSRRFPLLPESGKQNFQNA